MQAKLYGIGLVLSIAGILAQRNRRDVTSWMNSRRIDNKGKKKDPNKRICGVCGNEMILKTRHTGKDAGTRYWVCSMYPDCRKVEKEEQQKAGL